MRAGRGRRHVRRAPRRLRAHRLLVIPPVVDQGAELAQRPPSYLQDLLNTRLGPRELDRSYDVMDRVQAEVDGADVRRAVHRGRARRRPRSRPAVLSGVFQVFTVLVLTLYFLSSLPRSSTRPTPSSPPRRPASCSLSEEIIRRIGSYAIGQVAIASLNAVLSYVMMTIVGIPYAAVLAVTVGLLGLIPMIGATLGASVVVRRRLLRRPDQGAHRARLLPRLPAAGELRRGPARHAAHGVGARPVTIVAALAGGHSSGHRGPARHPRRSRAAAALRGGPGPRQSRA